MDRRAVVAEYKKRTTVAGLYALRCTITGAVWVGAARDIDKIFNRLKFSLTTGGWPHPGLQEAWKIHGAGAFQFETLERLPEAPTAYVRDAALKERLDFWRAKLGASLA